MGAAQGEYAGGSVKEHEETDGDRFQMEGGDMLEVERVWTAR